MLLIVVSAVDALFTALTIVVAIVYAVIICELIAVDADAAIKVASACFCDEVLVPAEPLDVNGLLLKLSAVIPVITEVLVIASFK